MTSFIKAEFLLLSMLLVLGVGLSAPPLKEQCGYKVGNLPECIDFARGKGRRPSSTCCAKAEDEKKNRPQCLCFYVQQIYNLQNSSFGLQYQRILQLPTACNIAGDLSVTLCTEVLGLTPSDPLYKVFNIQTAATTKITNDISPTEPPTADGDISSGLQRRISHASALLGAVTSAFLLALL